MRVSARMHYRHRVPAQELWSFRRVVELRRPSSTDLRERAAVDSLRAGRAGRAPRDDLLAARFSPRRRAGRPWRRRGAHSLFDQRDDDARSSGAAPPSSPPPRPSSPCAPASPGRGRHPRAQPPRTPSSLSEPKRAAAPAVRCRRVAGGAIALHARAGRGVGAARPRPPRYRRCAAARHLGHLRDLARRTHARPREELAPARPSGAEHDARPRRREILQASAGAGPPAGAGAALRASSALARPAPHAPPVRRHERRSSRPSGSFVVAPLAPRSNRAASRRRRARGRDHAADALDVDRPARAAAAASSVASSKEVSVAGSGSSA